LRRFGSAASCLFTSMIASMPARSLGGSCPTLRF
jgi:hypothetical protein